MLSCTKVTFPSSIPFCGLGGSPGSISTGLTDHRLNYGQFLALGVGGPHLLQQKSFLTSPLPISACPPLTVQRRSLRNFLLVGGRNRSEQTGSWVRWRVLGIHLGTPQNPQPHRCL